MPQVTINPVAVTVSAAAGTPLLAAILSSGQALQSKCNGQGQCGACHIFVHDGRKTLSKIQRVEHEKLDSIIGVGSKSRLACQAMVGEEDVTVELIGFNSGF